MNRISVRTRLIVALGILLTASFLVTNLINYNIARRTIRQDIAQNALPLISNNIYSEIQKDLMRPIFVSSLMANDTFLKDWILTGERPVELIRKYLKEIKDRYNFDSAFYISHRTRNYYHYTGILKKISPYDEHDVWYYDFVKMDVPYDLDVDTDEAAQNNLTIFINHRLAGYDGSFLGVTGVGLSMNLVGRLLSEYRDKYGRRVYLVDKDGLVQVHHDTSLIHNMNIKNIEGLAEYAASILDADNTGDLYEYEKDGRTILLLVRYVPEFNWFLCVEQDETAATTDIRRNLIANLGLGLLVTLLVIGIALFTVNYFQRRLELMAVTDRLTGVANRNELEEHIDRAFAAYEPDDTPLSLIILDIDDFKEINDTYGHLTGDRIIRKIAEAAEGCIRSRDLLVRWGGDEFMILTYSALDYALNIAERIRSTVAETPVEDQTREGGSINIFVTVSCGAAQRRTGDDKEKLIARADRALYRAKEQGRNRAASMPHEEA